jgi:TatD DNase family protein
MTKYIDIHTHNPREDVLSPTMAGIHPWEAEIGYELPCLTECDIIGETGLDYACEVDRYRQKELFLRHLAKAQQLGKPVVLHVVRALNDTLSILSEFKDLKGVVFHGFIGSKEQAAECIKRGYYLSFGERSLRSPKTREVIAKMPQNLLFCETDDNTSVAIEEIYRSVAEIRGTTPEELLRTIEDNYKNLFA